LLAKLDRRKAIQQPFNCTHELCEISNNATNSGCCYATMQIDARSIDPLTNIIEEFYSVSISDVFTTITTSMMTMGSLFAGVREEGYLIFC
jgi:hypothetical protein